jgi:hypothetical protein
LLIDRIMLSNSNGGWQRSSNDLSRIQTQNPSSTPVGSDQGDTGVREERLPNCFPLDTLVFVCEKDGSGIREIPIGEIERGMFVPSGGRRVNRVQKCIDAESTTLIAIELSNGITFRCSPSERFITSRADKTGTRIDHLTIGDEILCWNGEKVERATIEAYHEKRERVKIRTLSLTPGKTFVVAGGAIAHNLKILLD